MAGTTPTPTAIAFASYGLRIGIELFDAAIHDRVLECLPPGLVPATFDNLDRQYRLEDAGPESETRYGFFVDGNDGREGESDTIDGMLDMLEGDIQIHVAEFASPHLFVHAGVVAWQGRAIVLPGSSFAGKSTLVTSLVNAGASYYSDEYAVFDAHGHVLPYLRRVSLREGPHGPAGRLNLSHRAPVGDTTLDPLPVGLVALLRYQADAGWAVETLTGVRGIMAMCEHTVPIQRRPAETLGILGKIADSACVVQGTRGDVDDAVGRLLCMAVESVPGTNGSCADHQGSSSTRL
jgi:hypothetical protein